MGKVDTIEEQLKAANFLLKQLVTIHWTFLEAGDDKGLLTELNMALGHIQEYFDRYGV